MRRRRPERIESAFHPTPESKWRWRSWTANRTKVSPISFCPMSRSGGQLRLSCEHAQTVRRSKEKSMKYILMMNGPWEGIEPIGTWPKEDIRAHIGFMMKLNKEL